MVAATVTDISATVALIGVKFCMMVHIVPGQIVSPFRGGTPGVPKSKILGLNFNHLTANNLKNGRHVAALHQLDEGFLKKTKNVSHRAVAPQPPPPLPQGVHPRMAGVCVLLAHLVVY